MCDKMPEGNLFMVCRKVERGAFAPLPDGVTVRNCRPDELDIWKDFHFDTAREAQENRPFMDEFFDRVYAPHGDEFFRRCLFVCENDVPIGTCFIWKAYGCVNTVHWFKVRRECEGRGIGRALLTCVLEGLTEGDMPVCLHTQPSSFRAIKLYNDFGFALATDACIGGRDNSLPQALPALRRVMGRERFMALRMDSAPEELLRAAEACQWSEF